MTFALSAGSLGSCASAETTAKSNAADTTAAAVMIAIRHEWFTWNLPSSVGALQQFCGHADTTFPSGKVMTRNSPEREPSLARLASAVTVLPRAVSTSLLLMSRARKKLGGGPSSDQVCIDRRRLLH